MATTYTRTGDTGSTTLASGERAQKTDPRIDVIGEIEETRAHLALSHSFAADKAVQKALSDVARTLSSLATDVSSGTPDAHITTQVVEGIEHTIDALEAEVNGALSFETPGSLVASAQLSVTRAVARRCERTMWRERESANVGPLGLAYINRVSDLCSVCAHIEGKN